MLSATAVAPHTDAIVIARAYHELTKPGITLFVGLTALSGYVLNAGAQRDLVTAGLVILATMLMSGGAATLNQVAERRTDALMRRTSERPLPAGIITALQATVFGWTLSVVGAAIALLTLPLLSFVFLATCHVTYVYVYTPLKKKTTLCTLAGAVPGALPVLAGSAAAVGAPNTAALALTVLLFTWQIPHFFAIGWITRDDYARAGFNMLPVVDETGVVTARASLLYALATHGLAILVTREISASGLAMAAVHTAGTAYVLSVIPFLMNRTNARARRLFFTSLIVLPVILGALMLDVLLRS
jgi:heme o synthase